MGWALKYEGNQNSQLFSKEVLWLFSVTESGEGGREREGNRANVFQFPIERIREYQSHPHGVFYKPEFLNWICVLLLNN